jgi:membrane protease YdiL (CAAX protease family)
MESGAFSRPVYLRAPFSGPLLMTFLDPGSTRVDVFGLWFVFVMVVFIPIASIRSARRPVVTDESPQRITKRLRSVVLLAVIAVIALAVAWRDNISLFPPIVVTGRLVALSLAILLGVLALAEALLMARSPEKRRQLWVRQVIPQNNAERMVWIVSSATAGVTEEIIFRGVLFALLLALTSSIAAAALISAVVFAVAHARQGWKSTIFIFGTALLFQWLVIFSASLVPAMIVHGIYNIVRGFRASYGMGRAEY